MSEFLFYLQDLIFFHCRLAPFLLILLISFEAEAQQKRTKKSGKKTKVDTVYVQSGNIVLLQDSVYYVRSDTSFIVSNKTRFKVRRDPLKRNQRFYDSLRAKSSNSAVTKELYKAFFRYRNPIQRDTFPSENRLKYFRQYEGKNIGTIRFKRVDVIEGSVLDTTLIAESRFGKTANSLKWNTRSKIISNYLLFSDGDSFKAFEFLDTERVLRSTGFIEDARIYISERDDSEESIDVIIVIKEVFSVGVNLEIRDIDVYRLTLFDKNFLGLGHEVRQTLIYDAGAKERIWGYNSSYLARNLGGSFIDNTIRYEKSDQFEVFNISYQKDFLTPATKYAGGVDLTFLTEPRIETYLDSVFIQPFQANLQDFWIGRSFMILPTNSSKRKNITFAGRYIKSKYLLRPPVKSDSNFFFHNFKSALFSLAYSRIEFKKNNMILGFGRTEDVPEGFLVEILGGIEDAEFFNRVYVGARVGIGKFFPWGYLQLSNAFSTFIRNHSTESGVYRINGTYFTNLAKLNNWNFRYFGRLNYVLGIDRIIEGEDIQFQQSVRDINDVEGSEKLTLSQDANFFSPWNLIGFRFNFVGFLDIGLMADENETLFNKNNFFSSLGIEIRIRNESLVFQTLSLRFSYFPAGNGSGDSYKFRIKTSEPSAFSLIRTGKPVIIPFD